MLKLIGRYKTKVSNPSFVSYSSNSKVPKSRIFGGMHQKYPNGLQRDTEGKGIMSLDHLAEFSAQTSPQPTPSESLRGGSGTYLLLLGTTGVVILITRAGK